MAIDEICFHGRQGKADAVVVARGSCDLRVDANHFSAHVHKWTTAVSAIDGGIGLQKALKVCEERSLAFLLGNDAGGDGLIETKRRTDRQNPVTNLGGIGVAESHGRQISRGIDLYDCNVRFLVNADHAAAKFFAGLQAHDDSRFEPSTTCSLVRMYPFGLTMKPLPTPREGRRA